MRDIIKHIIEKIFATKTETPARESFEEVQNDIEYLKSVYSDIGMKLIDISYKEHIAKSHSYENGQIWLNKTYMSYAVLYFAKDLKSGMNMKK